jgi:phage tail-like protein
MRRTEIERLLPQIFQRTLQPGGPLVALLTVMEDLHQPAERVLEQLETYFDPRRCPDAFVPLLARWVDLGWLLTAGEPDDTATPEASWPSGLGRLREVVAAAAYLSQWRGTAVGLLHFLETATGVSGFQIDEQVTDPSGRVQPFHLRIHLPPAAQPYQTLIERIIESEKPAYVTYELAGQ